MNVHLLLNKSIVLEHAGRLRLHLSLGKVHLSLRKVPVTMLLHHWW
jgi:hypothetical protein